MALYPSQLFNAWVYRDSLRSFGNVSLRTLSIVTLIGGAVGAVLLLKTPTHAFDVTLPWLMLCATLALAFAKRWGEYERPSHLVGGHGEYGGSDDFSCRARGILARSIGAFVRRVAGRLPGFANRQTRVRPHDARTDISALHQHHGCIFCEGVSPMRGAPVYYQDRMTSNRVRRV